MDNCCPGSWIACIVWFGLELGRVRRGCGSVMISASAIRSMTTRARMSL